MGETTKPDKDEHVGNKKGQTGPFFLIRLDKLDLEGDSEETGKGGNDRPIGYEDGFVFLFYWLPVFGPISGFQERKRTTSALFSFLFFSFLVFKKKFEEKRIVFS